MINADAGFNDPQCKEFQFKKFLWRAPLAALRSVDLTPEGEMLTVKMKFDITKQAEVLNNAGYPTDKKAKLKEKRKLQFSDMQTAQNFVYQLKRLSHLLTNTNSCPYPFPQKLAVGEGKK